MEEEQRPNPRHCYSSSLDLKPRDKYAIFHKCQRAFMWPHNFVNFSSCEILAVSVVRRVRYWSSGISLNRTVGRRKVAVEQTAQQAPARLKSSAFLSCLQQASTTPGSHLSQLNYPGALNHSAQVLGDQRQRKGARTSHEYLQLSNSQVLLRTWTP